jgi:hypothetical protein
MSETLLPGTYPIYEVNLSQPLPKDGSDPMFLIYAMAGTEIQQIVSQYLLVKWGYNDILVEVPESPLDKPILRLPNTGITPQLGIHARSRLPANIYETPYSQMTIAGRQEQISGYIAGGLAYLR